MELSGEAPSRGTVEEETRELLSRFSAELSLQDLSLENTVRTRLWARSRDVRMRASRERTHILSGKASASSSSFISLQHFDSNANVALDLLAMRPSSPVAETVAVQFEPPRAYLRYLRNDSIVFVSGFTSSEGRLEDQVPQVIADIEDTLKVAGTSRDKLVRLSAFLCRSQRLETLQALLKKANTGDGPQLEFGFVDGFAGETSLLEIEATAVI